MIPAITQDFDLNSFNAGLDECGLHPADLETKRVTYWSRSRSALWEKGRTSGHTQELEFRFDCDNDAILLLVRQKGPACHTNRTSCFFNKLINENETVILALVMISFTCLLFSRLTLVIP